MLIVLKCLILLLNSVMVVTVRYLLTVAAYSIGTKEF